jgi:hypothetical protein
MSDDDPAEVIGLRGRRYQDQGSPNGDRRLQSTYGIPHDSPVSVDPDRRSKKCSVARRGIETVRADRDLAVTGLINSSQELLKNVIKLLRTTAADELRSMEQDGHRR